MADEVYGEVSPIPTAELDMLKMILTPYDGKIVKHMPESERALVVFPNRAALEALQEIPSYTTVEVPAPAEETEALRTPRAEEEEGAESEKPQEDGAHDQDEDLFDIAQRAAETAKPVEEPTVERAPAPAAAEPRAAVETRAAAHEEESAGTVKRKPLPANDVFYIFGDANIVVPTWCLFLLAYAVLAVFGIC
ncbi:hypothetical protein BESB_000340 [Besnoitia besnoiti]|uniref:Transmembrane protein n=1 Tax=Besnoitia besnoiti TaxID=94643 RepID=A0A2A9MPG6_BESBE|nr:hypothetical protein BESB_000340 [Besnoitia besnoiti]PFH37692.1 hypothetical protein BESB_000340 [Besnoitia besnoiti]